jgi:hypothetical protein
MHGSQNLYHLQNSANLVFNATRIRDKENDVVQTKLNFTPADFVFDYMDQLVLLAG